jgi:hypothetical protein
MQHEPRGRRLRVARDERSHGGRLVRGEARVRHSAIQGVDLWLGKDPKEILLSVKRTDP